MKNILFRLLFLISLFSSVRLAYAQEELKKNEIQPVKNNPLEEFKTKKSMYSAWKFPVDAIYNLTALTSHITTLYPDSTVKIIQKNGTPILQDIFSVGAVFTPNDPNVELTGDNRVVSRFDWYEVDSIYVPYIYVRHHDSTEVNESKIAVVDTLLIQFFKFSQLEKGDFMDQSETEIYMKPKNWTLDLLGSNNSAYEIKVPLTSNDTTPRPDSSGWITKGKLIALPPGFHIDSDDESFFLNYTNSFAFGLSFKPMLENNIGDTLEALNGSSIKNKLNYFGYYGYTNNTVPVLQTKYINNAWFVPSSLAPGDTVNSWHNSIPGNAYESDRYISYAVHITCCPANVDELNGTLDFKSFPNPVSKHHHLQTDFNLVNSGVVRIELRDQLGRILQTVADEYYAAGKHSLEVNVSNLANGIYQYTIQVGNAITSQKISIVD